MNIINKFFLRTHISIINQLGRLIAVISAIIGVGILLAYSITKNPEYTYLGYFYLFIAFAINITIVLLLLISLFTNKEKENNTRNVLITIAFMLINIPLATICAAIGLNN